MKGRITAWALPALLVLAGPTWAQTAASGTTTEDKGSKKTVKKEEIKTWTMTVDGKEWSARPATPTVDGDTGLFRLSSAYTLPRRAFSFSLTRDNYDRDPKGIDYSEHGLNVGFGATDRLELFGHIGLQHRTKAHYLFQPGFWNEAPFINSGWETGFGDIRIGAKYKILDDYQHADPVGLAIKGKVKFPTADENKGLGTGATAFGVDLVLSKTINYNVDLHGSIGYEFTGDPDGADLANAFKWGVGLNVPACRWFQLHAEVTGKVYGDTAPQQTNPADLIVGPFISFAKGWFVRPAYSYALNYDPRGNGGSTGKKSGMNFAVGYHGGTPCCEVYVPPPPPPAPANRPPTVSLDCVKDTLLQGETTPCNATASDPDGDPLTYTWSSSAGRVTGSGANTTLDTGGVACDTTITVTVQVSDGRGGTASATDTVRVRCPEKAKPEAVTCTSGGFPRNLARLNNVDKACLDDVASKLRSDPRSRVIVVGYADSSERYADVTGRKRAEAVKNYLVKERGVDAARITAKSAGSSKPLDTGKSAASRAKNRRVDVIFVPEGATVPEDDD
jgi:outer membrane protein OmpA-like peptidoglycan-associated protein